MARKKEYEAKRDFKQTPEPRGSSKRITGKRKSALAFVVQKHAATRLHYDLRLEMEGTLKSWAVPKGFPSKKGDKSLAIHVEDHPLEYGGFEGTIPKGNYGAGTVMLWDRGTYKVSGDDPPKAYREGKIHFCLAGSKLKGEWTLVRARSIDDGDKEHWLLIKSDADVKPLSARKDDESVLSGRTLKQISEGDAAGGKKTTGGRKEKQKAKSAAPKAPAGAPEFVSPMKAKRTEVPPTGEDWIYELKLDGFRATGIRNGYSVELISRNNKSLKQTFPEVAEALRELPAKKAVVDGEIVALDPDGRSSFQLLQSCLGGKASSAEAPPIVYYLFDLLNLDGRDLTKLPLHQRKEMLEQLVADLDEPIRFSAALKGDPHRIIEEVQKLGLEGIIAKRSDGSYETGRRSGSWLKIKCLNEQEFVVGGYTKPSGTRKYFGALLVGVNEKGKLKFSSKVGTGFDSHWLRRLHEEFQERIVEKCPFTDLPSPRGSKWGQAITASQMKNCTWVKPDMVCQIRFTEWTGDNHLRHPVFIGLRPDKKARDVVRE